MLKIADTAPISALKSCGAPGRGKPLVELRNPTKSLENVNTHAVFIHGLRGSMEETWHSATEPPEFWPDWLAADLPQVAVWSVGYPAAATRWFGGTAMAIQTRARNILPRLVQEQGLTTGTIILAGHSMGGLIAIELLRHAQSVAAHQPAIAAFLSRVRKLAFIGTPHRGSDQAGWLSRIPLFRASDAARGLVRNDAHLIDLNHWFRGYSFQNKIECVVLQETLRRRLFGTIVKFDSSDPGLAPSNQVIPLDEDHNSIVSPSGRNAEVYRYILDFVSRPATSLSPQDQILDELRSLGRRFDEQFPASPADGPITSKPGIDAAPASASSTSAAIFVLNLEGTEADFPPERQNEILEALRALTGNANLQIVRAGSGSFRLVIAGTLADRNKIDRAEVYATFTEKLGVRLIGVADFDAHESAKHHTDVLYKISEPLRLWPGTLPGGRKIERPERDQLLALFDTPEEGSTTALLGQPGSGKSALLADVTQELEKRGIPVFAIKADLLDPSIDAEQKLQSYLGLAELPSKLLARMAALRPVALIIDQLDALAGYLDLRTGRLNVLLNLIRTLSGERNLHIIVSARTFEFEHDARLKLVQAQRLTLDLPTWEQILPILEANGINAGGWPADVQEVMRAPQALATYLKLDNRADNSPHKTYQLMLAQLWRERVLSHANGARLSELAGVIAEDMAEKETLWVAAANFDSWTTELDQLIATGILTDFGSPGRIGFSHQTVFEHALARVFTQSEGRLSAYILERQASLFVRPKLWTALTYLRDVDQSVYLSELDALWSQSDLRYHLRHLLVDFLGQQQDPLDRESQLMAEALVGDIRRHALQAIAGSPGWFNHFASTVIRNAMTDEQNLSNSAQILSKAWVFAAPVVADLVREKWLPDPRFDTVVWNVIQDAEWNDALTEIALVILRRARVAAWAFDHLISTVGQDHPFDAMKIVETRLHRELDLAIDESRKRLETKPDHNDDENYLGWYLSYSPKRPITELAESSDGWDSLEALARSQPQVFIDHLWPWFQRVFAELRALSDQERGVGFALDYELDFRFEEENQHGLNEPPLLGAIRVAAETLAKQDPKSFVDWLSKVKDEDAEPAQRLFAHALASQPAIYASRTLSFLLDNPKRLHLGSVGDTAGTTKRLVKAASPHWTDAEINAFADAALAYAPRPHDDLDADGRRRFQQAVDRIRLAVLRQIPDALRPAAARLFIDEQARRFPGSDTTAIVRGPRSIGSPMSAASFKLAADSDIIRAFSELPDSTGWDHPKSWEKGGNIQLSREFAEFAITDHDRAIRIIGKLEPANGERAAGYAIKAMADTADPGAIAGLIQELAARGFGGAEFRGCVAGAIEQLLRRNVDIDEKTIAILTGWLDAQAPSDADGEEEDADALDTGDRLNSTEEPQESILWGGSRIATLPDGNYPILEVLVRVFLKANQHRRLLGILEEHLDRPEDVAVWKALLRFVPYIKDDGASSPVGFLRALFDKYPDLAATHETALLLARIQWHHPEFARSVLDKWQEAPSALTDLAFGEIVGMMSLVQPDVTWPHEQVEKLLEQKNPRALAGLAYAAIHVWADNANPKRASALLQRLIPLAETGTWHAILDLFRLVDDIAPTEEWVGFLQVLADNVARAPKVDPTFVIDRLQTLLPNEALLVAHTVNALVAKWRDELSDVTTSTAAASPDIIDIAITLHRIGGETRDLGTSIFEDLLRLDAYAARQTLHQIDNRVLNRPASIRRRLPRRARRPRRMHRAK